MKAVNACGHKKTESSLCCAKSVNTLSWGVCFVSVLQNQVLSDKSLPAPVSSNSSNLYTVQITKTLDRIGDVILSPLVFVCRLHPLPNSSHWGGPTRTLLILLPFNTKKPTNFGGVTSWWCLRSKSDPWSLSQSVSGLCKEARWGKNYKRW